MDCSPPGSSVHGIIQARILEWVAIPFSRGSSWPRDQTWVSCIAGRFFTIWATREAHGKPVPSSTTWARPSFPPHTMLKTLLAQSLHSEKLAKSSWAWIFPVGLTLPTPSLPSLTLVSVSWPNSEAHVFSSLVASGTGLLPPDWGLMTRRQAEFVRIITFAVWLKAVVLVLYYTNPCPTVSVLNWRAKGHSLWCTTTGSKYDIWFAVGRKILYLYICLMNRGFVMAYHVLWLQSSHLTLGLCFAHWLEWRGEVAHLPLRK